MWSSMCAHVKDVVNIILTIHTHTIRYTPRPVSQCDNVTGMTGACSASHVVHCARDSSGVVSRKFYGRIWITMSSHFRVNFTIVVHGVMGWYEWVRGWLRCLWRISTMWHKYQQVQTHGIGYRSIHVWNNAQSNVCASEVDVVGICQSRPGWGKTFIFGTIDLYSCAQHCHRYLSTRHFQSVLLAIAYSNSTTSTARTSNTIAFNRRHWIGEFRLTMSL